MISNGQNRTLLNVASTVLLQALTLFSGFLVPKLILDSFGSQINGLVSSISQFLGYISLVEGGVGSVILANLYKPLAEHDDNKVNAVVATANRFFKRLALVFLLYGLALAVVYPFFIEVSLTWGYISTLTLIMGLGTFIQYYFAITWRLLLQADQKMFVSAFVQGMAVILNLAATVVVIRLLPNIHVVKLVSGLSFFVQPLILNQYIKRNYEIDKYAKSDDSLLKQRWDGFGINVAAMVHTSTATIVLTLMTNLESVSVLSVYMLVVNGLKSLITSISAGIVPTIGNSYARGATEECNRLFDLYDFVMFFVSFLCYTVTAVTISHFALLYTSFATDADYWQPWLGIVLAISECMFCVREPYVNMAYSARLFRDVSKYAYVEAALNVLLSVAFTFMFGMIGVALGLMVSIVYRTFMQVWYVHKRTICRPVWPFLKKLILFGGISLVCFFASKRFIHIDDISVMSWCIYAVKVTLLEGICLAAVSVFGFRREFRELLSFLRRGNET